MEMEVCTAFFSLTNELNFLTASERSNKLSRPVKILVLISPPLVEFLHSNLANTSKDLQAYEESDSTLDHSFKDPQG